MLFETGWPLVFEKFLPEIESTRFWVHFYFEVQFKVKNCLKKYNNIEKIL